MYFLEFKNLISIVGSQRIRRKTFLVPNHHNYYAVLIRNYLLFLDAVYEKHSGKFRKKHHHLCTNFSFCSILFLYLFIRSFASKNPVYKFLHDTLVVVKTARMYKEMELY